MHYSLSSCCSFLVIPVPRHWDPASFFLDSSVEHWNDTSLGLF
ncbi:hypothetical protein OZD66_04940 [Wolbachia endosymbiont of Drosophila baimaii]|nr:hypothetical protein [Wolbachia endosymbiont of Drosophila baimaii]